MALGYYMYAEANDGEKNDTATMVSPPFSTAVGRSLQFWYHILTMQPKHYGPGHLQVLELILRSRYPNLNHLSQLETGNPSMVTKA